MPETSFLGRASWIPRTESYDSARVTTKRNVDRDFVSLSAVFRNPVTGSLADRPRALIREPVNPTDRKIGAFLRSGHPHFRRATCEKNRWGRREINCRIDGGAL